MFDKNATFTDARHISQVQSAVLTQIQLHKDCQDTRQAVSKFYLDRIACNAYEVLQGATPQLEDIDPYAIFSYLLTETVDQLGLSHTAYAIVDMLLSSKSKRPIETSPLRILDDEKFLKYYVRRFGVTEGLDRTRKAPIMRVHTDNRYIWRNPLEVYSRFVIQRSLHQVSVRRRNVCTVFNIHYRIQNALLDRCALLERLIRYVPFIKARKVIGAMRHKVHNFCKDLSGITEALRSRPALWIEEGSKLQFFEQMLSDYFDAFPELAHAYGEVLKWEEPSATQLRHPHLLLDEVKQHMFNIGVPRERIVEIFGSGTNVFMAKKCDELNKLLYTAA